MATQGKVNAGHWAAPALEPKRSHRFVLLLNSVPAYVIKKVSKPNFTVAETPHKFMNWTFWYPGKVEWDAVTFTLVDPVRPNAALALLEALKAGGYHYPNEGQENNTEMTVSKFRSTQALGSVKIQQLASSRSGTKAEVKENADQIVEEWELKNAWIQKVQYGELNYDNDALVETTVTLRYDWATMNQGSAAKWANNSDKGAAN